MHRAYRGGPLAWLVEDHLDPRCRFSGSRHCRAERNCGAEALDVLSDQVNPRKWPAFVTDGKECHNLWRLPTHHPCKEAEAGTAKEAIHAGDFGTSTYLNIGLRRSKSWTSEHTSDDSHVDTRELLDVPHRGNEDVRRIEEPRDHQRGDKLHPQWDWNSGRAKDLGADGGVSLHSISFFVLGVKEKVTVVCGDVAEVLVMVNHTYIDRGSEPGMRTLTSPLGPMRRASRAAVHLVPLCLRKASVLFGLKLISKLSVL